MPRSRRTSTAKTKTQTASEFTCPECGRSFARAAALGAHRRRAHGVPGANATKTGRKRGRRTAAAATVRTPASGRGRRGNSSTVDRDALLQAVFPNGLPAKEAVIRAANDWLNQAEQLAKMN